MEIDAGTREARVDGTDVRLKPREFALLIELAGNAGVTLSRDWLLQRVSGAAARRVTIHTHLPHAAQARIDGDACVHGNEPGTIEVSCHRGKRFVAVVVEGDGRGVLPEERELTFAMGVRGDAPARPGSSIGDAGRRTLRAALSGGIILDACRR